MVQDQPGQKISQDPISTNKKLGVVNYTCHHSCEGSLNRRSDVQASQSIYPRPYLKIAKAKKAGGVVQVIQHLLRKCDVVLSSKDSITYMMKKNDQSHALLHN
jgi:hypothetical protein